MLVPKCSRSRSIVRSLRALLAIGWTAALRVSYVAHSELISRWVLVYVSARRARRRSPNGWLSGRCRVRACCGLLMFAAVFSAALTSVGCNGKSRLPSLMDKLAKPEPYADASVWDEHTVGLPFVFGYEAGMQQATTQQRPAMIFLTTTWCKWCKKLAHDSLADAEVRSLLEQNFVLVLVDGDAEPSVRRKYKSTGYPHLLFVSPEEQVLASHNGYTSADQLKQLIHSVLGK